MLSRKFKVAGESLRNFAERIFSVKDLQEKCQTVFIINMNSNDTIIAVVLHNKSSVF